MSIATNLPSLAGNELDALFECKSLDDFVVTSMRILPKVVGSEVTCYNEFDVIARRTRIALDDSRMEMLLLAHPKRNLQALLQGNPLAQAALRGDTKSYRISDFIDMPTWQATEIYQLFFGPVGLSYQTALVLDTEPKHLVAFSFNRRNKDFSDADVANLNALRPQITRAYRVAVTAGAEKARRLRREEMLGRFGVLWIDLDPELTVLGAAPGALALLKHYYPSSREDAQRLPRVVEDWVLDVSNGSEPEMTLVTKSDQGRLIVSVFGSFDGPAVTLMLEHVTYETSPEALRPLGLTPRQSEVLFWLAQGKSNTEISIILGVSPRTIDNTVYRVFDALDVSNRTNAAQIAWDFLSRRSSEVR